MNELGVTAHLFCEFLEVAFHSILFQRKIYPSILFEKRQKYGVAVRFCKDDQVLQYVREIVLSMLPILASDECEAHRIVLAVVPNVNDNSNDRQINQNALEHQVYERHVIEVAVIAKTLDISELEDGFRQFLLRLDTINARIRPIPPNCSFRVLIYTNIYDAEKKKVWIPITTTNYDVYSPVLIPLCELDIHPIQMQMFIEENISYKQQQQHQQHQQLPYRFP